MNKKSIPRKSWLILLPVLLSTLLVARFISLSRATYLQGADAYYYALQIRSLLKTGALEIPDASPIYGLMALGVRLGLGIERSIILWTLLIQLLAAVNLLFAVRVIHGRDRWIGGWLLAAWAILSPTLSFTCIEFPKYALALAFLPLWPVGLVRKKWWAVSLGAIVLSGMCHRALIGLAGLAVFGAAAASYRVLLQRLRRFMQPWHLVLLVLGVLGLVVVFVLVGGKYFSLLDFKRLTFSGARPSLATFWGRRETPVSLKTEVILTLVVLAWLQLSTGRLSSERRPAVRLWLPFLLFLLLPLGADEVMGIPERLTLALPLVAACACVPATGLMERSGRCPRRRDARGGGGAPHSRRGLGRH